MAADKKQFTYDYPKADVTSSIIAYRRTSSGVELLAIRRGGEPFKGKLALPGGFLEVGRESLEECAARELEEETSLNLEVSRLQLVCVQSAPQRDPRGHVVDHVYSAELSEDEMKQAKAADDAASIEVVKIGGNELPNPSEWAFDHADSIQQFLRAQV